MSHLKAAINPAQNPLFFRAENGLRSAIFLILLILGTIPLMLFALLTWKSEAKTAEENPTFREGEEPLFSNNLSSYQRGSDSIKAATKSAGTGLRK